MKIADCKILTLDIFESRNF